MVRAVSPFAVALWAYFLTQRIMHWIGLQKIHLPANLEVLNLKNNVFSCFEILQRLVPAGNAIHRPYVGNSELVEENTHGRVRVFYCEEYYGYNFPAIPVSERGDIDVGR